MATDEQGSRRLIEDELATDWGLTDVGPLETTYDGTASVWAACSPAFGPVVLKVGSPGHDVSREAAALRAWDGRGAVRLLEHDVERGALLLERVTPGTPLDPEVLDDDACTRAIVGAARVIGVRAGPTDAARLPGLDAWLTDLDEHELRFPEDDPIGADLIGIARETLLQLLETTTESVVLHGDLHHDNVLRHGDGWVVIDPHGYVGDPAAEPATMLYNPIPYVFERADVDVPSLVERRLHVWSEESDLDPERVRQWALVKAVISEVWSAEDFGPATVDLLVARLLAAAR